jgi:hypothetical protein
MEGDDVVTDVFGEPWRVGQWTILSIGDGYHCEVLYTPRRTEIEQGDILWVHTYLRSESARDAPHDPRMYRYVDEPGPVTAVWWCEREEGLYKIKRREFFHAG